MKKQIVVIHGGRTFLEYQDYLDSLKTREVSIEKFKIQKDWKEGLQKELGEDFEVFNPKMPNGNNAVYQEWKIWFERLADFLHNDVILIGQSLGGIFLAKYLSENVFSKKIKAVVLVAAPFHEVGLQESLGGFLLPADLGNFFKQAEKILLLFSGDDPVVPFGHADLYHRTLPNSAVVPFADRQHFNQELFPELVALIKKISRP